MKKIQKIKTQSIEIMKSPNFDNKFGFGTIFADNMFIFERIEEKGEEKADISEKKQKNTENPGNKGIFFDNKAFGHLLTVGTVTHLSEDVALRLALNFSII